MQIERVDLDTNIENRKSVLQEYYARYLTKVRGSSESTVKHYLDALNNISRRLKEKEIVSKDIYEIMDLLILRSLNASFNVCVFGLKCPISIIMLPLAA